MPLVDEVVVLDVVREAGLLDRDLSVAQLPADGGEKEEDRGDPLLAVDEHAVAVGRLGDDAAEEVLLAPRLHDLHQVVEQAGAVLDPPVVVALVDRDYEAGLLPLHQVGQVLLVAVQVPLLVFRKGQAASLDGVRYGEAALPVAEADGDLGRAGLGDGPSPHAL